MDRYCKRLIEVDLPIKRISKNARHDRNIKKGHISALHIWWARRPLAACRAVICAALWPDPADALCPAPFYAAAAKAMTDRANNHTKLSGDQSCKRLLAVRQDPTLVDSPEYLRALLLDFIADFSSWENSDVEWYVRTARFLTGVAHESLTLEVANRPVLLDPFAGGGAIPTEGLRVGAETIAADLNPVAVLLNKILLDYVPRYGDLLLREVRTLGKHVRERVESQMVQFYPSDPDGFTPVAYLWARTLQCQGPGCGAEIPLINQMWIKKKAQPRWAYDIRLDPHKKQIGLEVVENPRTAAIAPGTSTQGTATCPLCGYTTPAGQVRDMGRKGRIGERLLSVILESPDGRSRRCRMPREGDIHAVVSAATALQDRPTSGFIKNLETEIPTSELRRVSVPLYGLTRFSHLFLPRQRLALVSFEEAIAHLRLEQGRAGVPVHGAALDIVAVAVSNMLHYNTNLSTYLSNGMISAFIQGTSLAMRSDFAEANPLMPRLVGGFQYALLKVCETIERMLHTANSVGTVAHGSATSIALPDDSVSLVFTDPPYYDSVPYSHLSDLFYVWLSANLGDGMSSMFGSPLTPKDDEIVEDRPHSMSPTRKGKDFFEAHMTSAMAETRRVIRPDSLQVVVFAHKSTTGWEAMLASLLASGWVIHAAWPIDTERPARMNAFQNASLLSSIHVVCRPRCEDKIGDWRQVLDELPKRIHAWMPRLAAEGVVGADAIFACLGPALEVFSRYSSVEKASGEEVHLSTYLQEVWAAVSREALSMIFEGADASGFEEDARLTAMWLWTLHTATNGDEATELDGKGKLIRGYALEYDAARKIAQGLGAHLENLAHVVEVSGDTATLLSPAARAKHLFGSPKPDLPRGKKAKKAQLSLNFVEQIDELEDQSADWAFDFAANPNPTVLDRVHQAMVLFGAGRAEAMKHLLGEEGAGRNLLFWRLAQALSALYPTGTEEKRWVDGVLARKKPLGF
jgi:adenine-specific DNA methylase